MFKHRIAVLCSLAFLASSSVIFGQFGSARFPGATGSPPVTPVGTSGMGSSWVLGLGLGSLGGAAGPMKPQLVRRTVLETIMVPVSPEELAEIQEYQAALAAMRAEDRTPEQKAAAKEALAKLVDKQFTRDLETREKEVAELEARTKKLREQFDKRKAAKDAIIELRLKTLQNEIDGLGFPAEAPVSGVHFGGFGSGLAGGNPLGGGSAPTYGQPTGELLKPSLDRPLDDAFNPVRPQPATENQNSEPVKAGANLLKNSSFEDGPNGWGTGATPETVEYTVSDKGGVNATPSARIHKTADTYFPIAEWTQRIGYDGKSPAIELSATVKTQDARKAVLDVMFLDDKDEWISHEWAAYIGEQGDDPQPLTHDFKEYKGTVAIPPNTKTIVIGLQDYGPGDVWFDDVKAVYRSELPKEPNNVPR